MRKLWLLGFLLSASSGMLAQDGVLKGTVKAGEEPLMMATVKVEGATGVKGATTDKSGSYRIENIEPGSYELKVNSLGHAPVSDRIVIKAGETVVRNIDMQEDRLDLGEVVVSATRYELDRQEAPVVVNVIGPKLLNATQSMSVSEGLNYRPGVRVETNCQNCGFTQVRLNGLEGAYSQILINSRPVFSALNSVYGLDQIPSNIVERIEIVRGGGSALYGSNAIAGTINIITRDPVENSWQISNNYSLIDGDVPDNTLNFNGSLVSEDLNSGVTFYGMFRDRGSFDANGDGFTEITEMDNTTFGTKAFFKPGELSKITLNFNSIREYRRGGNMLDRAPHFTDITEELDHNTIIGGLTYEQFSKDRKNKFTAYFSGQTTDRDSYYGGLGGGRTEADSIAARNAYGTTEDLALVSGLQFSRRFNAKSTVIVGMEHQMNDVRDEIPGYNRLVDQQVSSLGGYAQYEWKPGEVFTALIGARYDITVVDGTYRIGDVERSADPETGVLSPRLTVMYDITEHLQVRGGYARGFRAPQAFNEDLHISSVGGEPQFVILSDDLEKELSDSFTASLNYTRNFGKTQTNFLVEGFYTDLQNPFTQVSTGAVLPNGSILEEVQNGNGAYVAGANFELGVSPASNFQFQAGGTVQESIYKNEQVLFKPSSDNEDEPVVEVDEFTRTPSVYGYFAANFKPGDNWAVDFTGTYTGPMVVPRVVSESGYIDLVGSDSFFDANLKVAYHLDVRQEFHLELSAGVQNMFDSYQDDFDTGPTRDSDYIYGPARPRTFFVGIKIGDFH